MNRICILGSTGSIGTQTLDVAKHLGLEVCGLSANSDIDTLEKQLLQTKAKMCAVADRDKAKELEKRLQGKNIKVFSGKDSASMLATECKCETVVNAIIGFAGLLPTLCAIDSGKNIALANKETLVCAGKIVMQRARQKGVSVIPIDSEHCAIHQCLRAGSHNEIKRLIITASGGPFFGYTKEQLKTVTPEQALCHPNWSMGKGITIYSSTLVNKGLEMIEAMHLFDVDMQNIDVVVHRESIVHSMVEMNDGSVLAQLGVPDMRLCIQYALTYPTRMNGLSQRLDIVKASKLSFYDVDNNTFPSIDLARKAVKDGGVGTAVYNASNEVCVEEFLKKNISYTDIFDIMQKTVDKFSGCGNAESIQDVLDFDVKAREYSLSLVQK